MGLAMSMNLQKYLSKEGYPALIVWNRTASRADPLKPLGATVASTVEEAVSKSDIIFSCVTSPPFFA
jgi:3-hydroxyisobutyrate dehydrogenase-like beta-hydroxyacid dehydrogenase